MGHRAERIAIAFSPAPLAQLLRKIWRRLPGERRIARSRALTVIANDRSNTIVFPFPMEMGKLWDEVSSRLAPAGDKAPTAKRGPAARS